VTEQLDGLARAWRQAEPTLRFPDPDTSWVVVVAATFTRPLTGLADRLFALHDAVPVVGARLAPMGWVPGRPDEPVVVAGPLITPALLARFDLARHPPLRVVVDATAHHLALAGHHAAFDGRALVAMLSALAGSPIPGQAERGSAGPRGGRARALRRVLRPADVVASSTTVPTEETLVARDVELAGPAVTARLADAAVAAVAGHNARAGRRWRRIGISIGVGGPAGVGNVATHRRVDVTAGRPVVDAVQAALARPPEPTVGVASPTVTRLLAPVVSRFSDSLLVSNLGPCAVPHASRLEFYPVPRGRSAVALGAAAAADGTSTVTLRTRRLNRDDAEGILAAIAEHLGST
jgi:hypothetical protein